MQVLAPSLMLAGLMLGSAGTAPAGTTSWTPVGGSQDWFASTNWTPSLPAGADSVTVGGSNALVQGSTAAYAASLTIASGAVTVGDINSGILNVGGQVNLTGGRLNVSFGTVSLNTLAVGTLGSYADTKAGTLALVGTAPSIQLGAVSLVVNGQITGTSGLSLTGAGTLALANSNAYSGGTAISALATLAVGNGGTAGSLGTGDVNNVGSLVLNRSDSVVVTNLITGSGGLVQAGSGTATLTGSNTYSGSTTINAGALQVGNGGTTGALGSGSVVDNATLLFNRSDNLIFSGVVSGSGSVVQVANSTLTLLGNNTYSGTTTINNGTLLVGVSGTSGSLGTGAVIDNGSLVLDRSDGVVISNPIAGTGSLTQAGSGTLTLLGNNTYGGNTVVSFGTLQVGNGGALGSLGAGNLANSGAVIFNRSDTTGFAGVISGNGTVTQAGPGTFVLTGNNTYSGLTTISGGTLLVGNGGTTGLLGTGNVVDNGTLQFGRVDNLVVANPVSGTGSVQQVGSGVLTLTGNNTYSGGTQISAGALQIGNGGTTGSLGTGGTVDNAQLVFNRADSFSVDSPISGTGSVTQAGAGTVVLTANNTYAGPTTISSGTLQVGNGGTTGALGAGSVLNNGALVFNRSDSLSVGAGLGGTGNVTQAGTGTLILTANNTYTGTTTISSGTLQVGNGGLTGSVGTGGITANGRLVFNRLDNISIGNLIGGSGSLTQAGAGTLTLTASNTYSGGTSVSGGGTLRVLNGSAVGTGDVNVANGTLLLDSSSATTRTTLSVGGNYTQSASGVLQLGVGGSAASQFDQVQAGGRAAVAGTLQLVALGTYQPLHNTRLVLLTAGGGVSGQFASFVNNFSYSPLLTPQLVYDPKDITLFWAHASFQPYAANRNQQSVAGFLNSITTSASAGDSALINQLDYGYLANLRAGLAGAFNQISPAGLTAMFGSSFSVADLQSDQFLRRANELLADYPAIYAAALRDSAASPDAFDAYVKNPWSLYLELPVSSASVTADSEASGYDLTTRGVTAGLDRKVGEHFFGGFSAAYNSTSADLSDGSTVTAHSTFIDAYGLWASHGFHLLGMAGGTTNSYTSTRQSLGGIATGSTNGLGWIGLVGAGYDWKRGGWMVGSQADLQYSSSGIDQFRENGSLSPLLVPSQHAASAHSQVGLNLRYHHLVPQWSILTPQVYVGWRHELQGSQLSLNAQSASGLGQAFEVVGPKLGSDSIIGSVGLSLQWRPAMNTFLNYTQQMGRTGYEAKDFQFGARLSF